MQVDVDRNELLLYRLLRNAMETDCEARVKELYDEGNETHARFVAQSVAEIPLFLH